MSLDDLILSCKNTFSVCQSGTSRRLGGNLLLLLLLQHTAPEMFKTRAALFLRLGLPSTLIRQGNGALWKLFLKRKSLKTPAFRFSANGKHIQGRAFHLKQWRLDNRLTFLTEFYSNTNPRPVIVTLRIVDWKYLMRFQSENSVKFSNFFLLSVA